jgi:ubiquinol-cytochrome c reductase cytochrome b subunit
MFFILVYVHIARGLFFKSYLYPRILLWYSGIIIFILMMATAFMGYVLPWGQMSFWGATVITNLFTAIPVVGQKIAFWLWGGFAIDQATLGRFFSLHYTLPFVIVAFVLIHLTLLHIDGSTNNLGIPSNLDRAPFYPYFYLKDLFSLIVFLIAFLYFVFYLPNILGHPDNYIRANALVTPTHIVPEWYFLPFYAILRSIPNKLGGVFCMFSAILILAFLPIIDTNSTVRCTKFGGMYQSLFWYFIVLVCCLGWLGSQPAEPPYIIIGQFSTFFFIFIFLFLFMM